MLRFIGAGGLFAREKEAFRSMVERDPRARGKPRGDAHYRSDFESQEREFW